MKFVMVSIGIPAKAKSLIEHLELRNFERRLYVDPENILYNSLDLNKGVKETFFSIDTPFAFLERFTKANGTKELGEVLSKWNKAFYIPPKQDQAFNQGGTFLFDGEKTVFAHYDASTGAHSKIDDVIEMARAAKSEKQVKTLA